MSDSYVKFRNEMLAGGASDGPEPEATTGGSRAVIGISVIVALLVLLAVWSPWAFVFVIGLLVCVFLHEVGHFVTARWTGMKATQFFLFMGPKLWSFRRGETEYGLRAYPLGAFVRIIGMNNLDEVDPADEPRAYRNKSYPRRMLVITAGSLMHLIIALLLLTGVYATRGSLEQTGRVGFGSVVAGSPAAAAGLQTGDIVLSLDGVTPSSPDAFVAAVQAHRPGDVVQLVVERNGSIVTIDVALGANTNDGPSFGKGYLGVSSGFESDWVSHSVPQAVVEGGRDVGWMVGRSVSGVAAIVNPVNIWGHLVGTNDDLDTRPSTVVGITRASNDIGDASGLAGVLLTLAFVNVFVGLFNMLPLLPFDGGHAAIATYERLRSRRGREPYRADVGKMVPVAVAVLTLLAFVVITGLYLDIAKPL
jgi:membrane-associated protease RseP (regulator of RpoE activity)